MLCPKCGAECKDEWSFCPSCSSQLPKPEPLPLPSQAKTGSSGKDPQGRQPKMPRFVWKAAAVVVVLFIGMFMFNDRQEEASQKAAVEKVKACLAAGFVDDKDITKANLGDVDGAKKALVTISSPRAAVKDQYGALKAEIAQREDGLKVKAAATVLANKKASFEELKTARDPLKGIASESRYNEAAQPVLAGLNEQIDRLALAKAKESLNQLDVKSVWANLAEISSGSVVKPEADIVRDRTRDVEKEAQAIVARAARGQYGKSLEQIFLKQGMDVYVTLSGPEDKHLSLRYILWSRPLVMKFAGEGRILDTARTLGFTQVTFETGGYMGEWWRYDL